MLVLSRRAGEAILIGEDVRIVVLETRGDVVRLGIEAPRGVSILREEIFMQILEENRSAAERSQNAEEVVAVWKDRMERR
ncbi:carbon storage regulator CsrA [Kyrpidia sp.]|uniref:carbon storage regulator CsrA n=1 Tax=Kyrpidia sp. TaxID=2073077 RepID=UPI0025901D1F|nr:carbon storage regulator CsrA [Kyrpidia sp.]MCL6577622.1 carbon storage regulator CsrA [Kyrpidia sp.]